jgi:hypothetical protein
MCFTITFFCFGLGALRITIVRLCFEKFRGTATVSGELGVGKRVKVTARPGEESAVAIAYP